MSALANINDLLQSMVIVSCLYQLLGASICHIEINISMAVVLSFSYDLIRSGEFHTEINRSKTILPHSQMANANSSHLNI